MTGVGPGPLPGIRVRRRMTARDIDESHRASSPLELFFDLTFVVAIAQIVIEFAHDIAEDHAIEGTVPFLMVFFAIWWAWMNFTWFASAYDTDDVPYRIMTMVQMAGVLVLAAGVPLALNELDFSVVVIGYFIMRVGLVSQWIRVAIEHPEGRRMARRYAIGISVLQVGWWLNLFLPADAPIIRFAILVTLELLVPVWAGRRGEPSWHPHHIAERYGLFTIIVLGESVLAATTGVQASLTESGVSGELVIVAVAGLLLIFALWWLYFLEPAGDGLARHRSRSYLWGYGHFGIFAALAALGAALEVVVEATGHALEASETSVALAVAIPVAVFLVLLWALHSRLVDDLVISPALILPAAAVVAVSPAAVGTVGLPGVVVVIALVCAVTVAGTILRRSRALHP